MEILMYFLWLIVVTYIILTIDSIRTRTLEETIQRTIDYHSIIIHYRMHRKIQISFSDLSYGVGIFNRKIFSLVDSFKELIYNKLVGLYILILIAIDSVNEKY